MAREQATPGVEQVNQKVILRVTVFLKSLLTVCSQETSTMTRIHFQVWVLVTHLTWSVSSEWDDATDVPPSSVHERVEPLLHICYDGILDVVFTTVHDETFIFKGKYYWQV